MSGVEGNEERNFYEKTFGSRFGGGRAGHCGARKRARAVFASHRRPGSFREYWCSAATFCPVSGADICAARGRCRSPSGLSAASRSEEHTSELQSPYVI